MNTQIKGHLQVTRTLTVAGRTTSRGNMDVSGNLHVGGWLDARNVKAPCKGLFASAQDLGRLYPEPKPGWWALVGDSLPAAIYRSDGEDWVDTGATGGEISIDLNAYDDAIERIDNSVADINDEIERIDNDIANIPHPVTVADTDTAADLDIADEEGNVLARYANGHVATAAFDSANITARGITGPDTAADLDIADTAGNVLARFAGGHVATAAFDSANITAKAVTGPDITGADLAVADSRGNVLMTVAGGHIRTAAFNSANITASSNLLVDTVTGKRYRLAVSDGSLGITPEEDDGDTGDEPIVIPTTISNILVLGNSITRHPVYPSYGWNCERGMAATVDANDYVSLLAEGTGAHVEVAHVGNAVNCVAFEGGYSSFLYGNFVFDRTIAYDLVIVALCENAAYSETMTEAWRGLYQWVRRTCPQARVLQLIAWDSPQRTAAIQAACEAEDVELMNNSELTYTESLAAGQYITDSTNETANTITSAIITHPSDVGMLLIANRILQWLHYPQLSYRHDITFVCSGEGTVSAFNGHDSAVYRGLVTISASSAPASISAADAKSNAVALTARGSGIYTFIMPDSDVTVSAVF